MTFIATSKTEPPASGMFYDSSVPTYTPPTPFPKEVWNDGSGDLSSPPIPVSGLNRLGFEGLNLPVDCFSSRHKFYGVPPNGWFYIRSPGPIPGSIGSFHNGYTPGFLRTWAIGDCVSETDEFTIRGKFFIRLFGGNVLASMFNWVTETTFSAVNILNEPQPPVGVITPVSVSSPVGSSGNGMMLLL